MYVKGLMVGDPIHPQTSIDCLCSFTNLAYGWLTYSPLFIYSPLYDCTLQNLPNTKPQADEAAEHHI